jgi:tRNA (guanine37-N1)-methyltransferase
LGNRESLEEERISAGKFYTKPRILKWKKKEYPVPDVLLSGNHKKIEEWKRKNS